ncbi:hypothetical protein MP638_002578 [Amoeboaphelidium occidentale]|nr:hypothetical protein MP638_002578 [Amoeboaphelidium occidentale]
MKGFFPSPVLLTRPSSLLSLVPMPQGKNALEKVSARFYAKPTRSVRQAALPSISMNFPKDRAEPDALIPYYKPLPIRPEFESDRDQLSLNDLKAIAIQTEFHHTPATTSDKFAFNLVKLLRKPSDLFFSHRYIHRALLLETVAAIPGQVAALLKHLKQLRNLDEKDDPIIQHLVHEAENERMHLVCFRELAAPTLMDRLVVSSVQLIFFNSYFFLYLFAPKVAHRMVGYLEEEAIISYTRFINEIQEGNIQNVPAPKMAIEYWNLKHDAKLLEVVYAVRADEAKHRDVNHHLAQ